MSEDARGPDTLQIGPGVAEHDPLGRDRLTTLDHPMPSLLGPHPARRAALFAAIGVGVGFWAGHGVGVFEGVVAGVAATFAMVVFTVLMPDPPEPGAPVFPEDPPESEEAAPAPQNRAQRRAAAKEARRKGKKAEPRLGGAPKPTGPPPKNRR